MVDNMGTLLVAQVRDDGGLSRVMPKRMEEVDR